MQVDLIDWMGTDLTVVNAARVSFDKLSDWVSTSEADELRSSDTKLIKYLAKHDHWSPFAHTSVQLHVKAPIFIARQLGKHQVGLVWNEVSRRYVDSEPEFYVPDAWRKRAENVKQGSSDEVVAEAVACGRCLNCTALLTGRKTKFCSATCQSKHWHSENPYRLRFSRWRASAKESGVPFTITEEDLDWPRVCPYLDVPLQYEDTERGPFTASLDRIVPALGYIPGNVQIISLRANKMKSDASPEELKAFAKNAALIHGGVFVDQSSSYEGFCKEMGASYRRLIDAGVCAEQARMILPQSAYTEWYWTGSLFAFARVVNLRSDPHAQKECRDIAKMIHMHIKELFPVSTEALCPPY